jgi:putative Mg2+ transporter-C (MgtC) family protein
MLTVQALVQEIPRFTDPVTPMGVAAEGLHLGAAIVAGAALGLNRNLRGKAAGLRTHALVSLGAALVILACRELGVGDVTRALQGVITGVGFLGAGVILHPRSTGAEVVRGLTTAASVWMAAALGIAAGAGLWSLLAMGTVATLAVLLGGGEVERVARRRLARQRGLDRLTPVDAGPAIAPPQSDGAAPPHRVERSEPAGRRRPRA